MSKRRIKTYERIEDIGPTFDRVSVEDVQRGLGAVAEPAERNAEGSPIAVAALGRRLATDLVSKGGRPSRKEAVTVKKIPVTAKESLILDELAELIRRDGRLKVTPAQVAAQLLHDSLRQFDRIEQRSGLDGSGRDRSVSEDEAMLEEILAAAASATRQLEQLRPVARELLKRMRAGKGIETDDEQ